MLRPLLILTALLPCASATAQDLVPGRWHGALAGPGGEIPFDLALDVADDGALSGRLLEPVALYGLVMKPYAARYEDLGIEPLRVVRDGDRLALSIDAYDSHLEGTLSPDGASLVGTWRKRSGRAAWAELPFHAVAGMRPVWPPGGTKQGGPPGPLTGRWSVDFSSSDDPAVMVLREDYLGRVNGTILTVVGDHRFLSGRHEGDAVELSTFDGAHAFRFTATLADGAGGRKRLAGDFWSRDTWHETWTAEQDDDARLPDPFTQTVWKDDVVLADLAFPDLDGNPRSLADPAFAGKALILQVFGTWCPNCSDETRYLVELDERFRDAGLSIVGLAFELTGDPVRDAAQVRAYAASRGVTYPLLLAGTADKDAATEALAALDRVRAFPTTIFLTGDGRVRAVHSGFAGPATGPAHETLRAEFERLIQELLAEDDDAATLASWEYLRSVDLFDHQAFAGGDYRFFDDDGARKVLHRTFGSGRPVIATEVLPVRVRGAAVWIGDEPWHLEREIDALTSPRDAGARLASFDAERRLLAARGYRGDGSASDAERDLVRALADPDSLVRREAVWHLAQARSPSAASRLTEVVPLLADPDRRVRLCAAWAVAEVGEPEAIDALEANLSSRDAALRRESVRALGRLARLRRFAEETRDIPARLAELADDPDPLVRAAVSAALSD